MNKGPKATIRLVRRQNHAGTTVSWTTVQREKSSHAYKLSSNVQTACSTDSLNNCPKHSLKMEQISHFECSGELSEW